MSAEGQGARGEPLNGRRLDEIEKDIGDLSKGLEELRRWQMQVERQLSAQSEMCRSHRARTQEDHNEIRSVRDLIGTLLVEHGKLKVRVMMMAGLGAGVAGFAGAVVSRLVRF